MDQSTPWAVLADELGHLGWAFGLGFCVFFAVINCDILSIVKFRLKSSFIQYCLYLLRQRLWSYGTMALCRCSTIIIILYYYYYVFFWTRCVWLIVSWFARLSVLYVLGIFFFVLYFVVIWLPINRDGGLGVATLTLWGHSEPQNLKKFKFWGLKKFKKFDSE